jgi:hypothetical protein
VEGYVDQPVEDGRVDRAEVLGHHGGAAPGWQSSSCRRDARHDRLLAVGWLA